MNFRRLKWPVLGAWLLIAVTAGMFASKLESVETNDNRTFLPATAESTHALDLPFDADEPQSLLLIYVREGGITDADRAAAQADATALSGRPPIPSDNALLVTVPLTAEQVTEEAIGPIVANARSVLADGLPSGLNAQVTGGPAIEADFDAAFDTLDTRLLLVTIAVVALLLLITYRSPVLLLLPLISVGIASEVAKALIYVCAKAFDLLVDPASMGILTVLVFGAGTDYALLLISRYREELRTHADRHVAMWNAWRRSMPAILASAATVVLALLTLMFADMNSTRGLGPIAALGITGAFLVMSTLLPALLVLCGRWVFWPLVPRAGSSKVESTRLASFVSRRARPIWIVTALGLTALTFAATTLSTGLKMSDSFITKPDSVAGFEALAVHYPAGSGDPTFVYTPTSSSASVLTALGSVSGIAEVRSADQSGSWTRIPVVLSDDSAQTVLRIRNAVHAVSAESLVGGATAQELDKDTTMDSDLRLLIPLILLVVLVVLIVLLRSLVAPLLLLGSVVLSFGAALGASTLIYQAIGFPAIDKAVILNGFLFLVALGVDYTIFLMTRAREEVAVVGHELGVPRALTVTGGVITSAGVVLAATFAVLTVMPIVFMMQIGVLVAVGVLLDTFVVRSLLVPALILDVGRRSWWPGALSVDRGNPAGVGAPPELPRSRRDAAASTR